MLRDYQGSTNQQIPELYPRTLIWNTNLIWDYSQWIPQVVVINLGTNDFNLGAPDVSSGI